MLHAVILDIFKKGRLGQLSGLVDRRNVAFRRVLEKCGFSLSSEAPKKTESVEMLWYRWGAGQAL